jgi:membrane protease YdiL (CAAX protease family)
MKVLFLHGWNSVPGGVKPAYLKDHGHEVVNPKLHDEDFAEAVRIAQVEFDKHQPQVVVGSSRGGAVAMNIKSGAAKLVLLSPAWKKYGTARKVKPGTVILHSRADDVISFSDSEELVRNSGLPVSALIEVGIDHRLADQEPLEAMLRECDGARAKRPERSMAGWAHLATFFLLAYAVTWACWLPLVRANGERIGGPFSANILATLGQFGPFAAALVVAGVGGGLSGLRDLFRRLFMWRVNPLWFGVALILPPILAVAAIAIQTAMIGDSLDLRLFDPSLEILPHFLLVLLVGGPLGEELGWRGFALPRLQAIGRLWLSTLLLALAWAGWHLPLWWIAEIPSSFAFYVVGVIPLTFLFTWLSVRSSGSVLIAMLFHASINTCIVRLPLFAAFVPWTALLWIVAAVVLFFDGAELLHSRIPPNDSSRENRSSDVRAE